MRISAAIAVALLLALGSSAGAATWGANMTYDASYGLLPNNPNGTFPGFTRELDSADPPSSGGQYDFSTQMPGYDDGGVMCEKDQIYSTVYLKPKAYRVDYKTDGQSAWSLTNDPQSHIGAIWWFKIDNMSEPGGRQFSVPVLRLQISGQKKFEIYYNSGGYFEGGPWGSGGPSTQIWSESGRWPYNKIYAAPGQWHTLRMSIFQSAGWWWLDEGTPYEEDRAGQCGQSAGGTSRVQFENYFNPNVVIEGGDENKDRSNITWFNMDIETRYFCFDQSRSMHDPATYPLPFTPEVTVPTVSQAVTGGRAHNCVWRITGDAVITDVRKSGSSQIGFWVQDVNSPDRINLYIPTTNTTNVAVGHKVTGISGIIQWAPGMGASMSGGASFIATATHADAFPFCMLEKALVCSGIPTDYPAGTENTSRFVRIAGKITRITGDPNAPTVYVDDGSGLIDGRSGTGSDPAAKGVRMIVDDPLFSTMYAEGQTVVVDGICGYETWTEGAVSKTVRTILSPVFRYP